MMNNLQIILALVLVLTVLDAFILLAVSVWLKGEPRTMALEISRTLCYVSMATLIAFAIASWWR